MVHPNFLGKSEQLASQNSWQKDTHSASTFASTVTKYEGKLVHAHDSSRQKVMPYCFQETVLLRLDSHQLH